MGIDLKEKFKNLIDRRQIVRLFYDAIIKNKVREEIRRYDEDILLDYDVTGG